MLSQRSSSKRDRNGWMEGARAGAWASINEMKPSSDPLPKATNYGELSESMTRGRWQALDEPRS